MQVQDTELIQALPKSNQQLESDHVAQTSIKIGQTEFIKVCRAQAISLLHLKVISLTHLHCSAIRRRVNLIIR